MRVDQLDSGVHDGAEGFVEFQPGCDDQHRVEQPVQPVTAFNDLLDAVLDFHEQLAEPQLGQRVPERTHAGFNARLDVAGHLVIVPPT